MVSLPLREVKQLMSWYVYICTNPFYRLLFNCIFCSRSAFFSKMCYKIINSHVCFLCVHYRMRMQRLQRLDDNRFMFIKRQLKNVQIRCYVLMLVEKCKFWDYNCVSTIALFYSL
jgi:hypothetical protein